MNILSLLSFFAFLFYLTQGILVFKADRYSLPNRIFLLLSISMAIWSFGYTFVYPNHELSDPIFWFWNKFAAFGWCTYSAFVVHLSLVVTGREKSIRRWHYPIIYGPSFVALVIDLIVFSASFHPAEALNLFSLFYGAYYALNIFASLVMIGLWGHRSQIRREKRYALIIILSGALTLLLGFTTQSILHLIWPEFFPQIAQIIALIYAGGVGYTISKYKLMNLTALVSDSQILAEINDFFILTDVGFNIVHLNHRVVVLLGYDRKTLLGTPLTKILDRKVNIGIFDFGLPRHEEISLMSKLGESIPVRIFVNAVRDIVGDKVGILLIGQDLRLTKKLEREINDRQRAEAILHKLSFHDSLTGLYNRTFFEDEMKRLKKSPASLGIVVVDVDGLKLINDTLGHAAGDQLIITTSIALQNSVGEQGIIARIGGDEFAVLIENTTEEHVINLAKKIKKEEISFAVVHTDFQLSLSVGTAFGGSWVPKEDLFKEADDNMYREKLFKSNNARSTIIRTLTETLQARDYIAEGHADQLLVFVEELAKTKQFQRPKINDLHMFAQFHDLGKVGIPDSILFKPGPLTSEERKIMQRHSEIGYRIALSAQELMPLADWILKHHEWWNGRGYPLGLKEQDIPLECRIIAIVDAYSAMISDRPYRQAMSKEKALQELKLGAGTQFDPNLVDIFIMLQG